MFGLASPSQGCWDHMVTLETKNANVEMVGGVCLLGVVLGGLATVGVTRTV